MPFGLLTLCNEDDYEMQLSWCHIHKDKSARENSISLWTERHTFPNVGTTF
jgi:hypothetical protein